MVIMSFFKCCTRQPDICDFFFSKDTVALYMMQLERQFLSSGNLVGCLHIYIYTHIYMYIYMCIYVYM